MSTSLPPLNTPSYQPPPRHDPPAGDWKAEGMRGFWKQDREIIRLVVCLVAIFGLIHYGMNRMDSQVDRLKERDLLIDRQHGERVQAVIDTSAKSLTEVKDGFKDAAERNERLYQRLYDRNVGVGAKP